MLWVIVWDIYLRMQLVWEEMQGSAGKKILHSDAIAFFDGDTRNRLCASKGKDTSCITFNGHAVFASNETWALAYRTQPKYDTCTLCVKSLHDVIIPSPHHLPVGRKRKVSGTS